MGNTPESQIGKAETIEGGIIVPLSTQELHAKIKDVQEKKELSKKSVSTATPSDELGAFRQAEREKGATIEIRNDTVDILAKTPGVAANFGGNIEAYKTIVGDKRGDWRFAANTPELVTIVKNSTAIEKAALSTDPSIIIPEGYKSRGQPEMSLDARTEGNLREKKDGSFQDRFILRPEGKTSSKPETPPTPPSGSEITVNNFTPGQQATAR